MLPFSECWGSVSWAGARSSFISSLESSAPERWAVCGWGHRVIAGKRLQQCCCCPIFIMSAKALVSSLWFPPHHFHSLVMSDLLNRYDYPPMSVLCCIALQSPLLPWLWLALFKEKMSGFAQLPTQNPLSETAAYFPKHPDFPCRRFWLHVQFTGCLGKLGALQGFAVGVWFCNLSQSWDSTLESVGSWNVFTWEWGGGTTLGRCLMCQL